MGKLILGLNINHADSSAALVRNRQVVCATEEERFTRMKHWAGTPMQAIEFCLNHQNISIKEIDEIAIGSVKNPKLYRKILFTLRRPIAALSILIGKNSANTGFVDLRHSITEKFGYCPPIERVEHHVAHISSAYYASPFQNSALLSIDGSGDFTTLMIAKGISGRIEVLYSCDFPVSIGLFYTAFTQFLGFPYYGDEYKVMGLSPYGKPIYKKEMSNLLWFDSQNGKLCWNQKYFDISKGVIDYKNNNPIVKPLYNRIKFESLFGVQSRKKGESIEQIHKNIAASLQNHVEDIIFQICEFVFDKTQIDNICIAGGVAQNSVANGKILSRTKFTNLYIPSAGHDAGISMGAALYRFYTSHPSKFSSREPLWDANLGIDFSNSQVEEILRKKGLNYKYLESIDLYRYVAGKIADGHVVGWFNGRAEFGPRALGSRSILADPRNPKAQELLNLKIKKRESFRPFAPSIMEEFGEEWFEEYQFTPFMERVLKIRPEKRNLIPAVTHVDGSGRLQSVRKDLRPHYHRLISEFEVLTGVPILINTSFNENEPVVNHPNEAIATFLRTDLDLLVIENYILEKNEN